MKTQMVAGIQVCYESSEQSAAGIIADTCELTIQFVQAGWDLPLPKHCQVLVMTSWQQFYLYSAPWPWRGFLWLSLPLWVGRVRSFWLYAGGWAQSYGSRRVIGIKPPRLIQAADRSLGSQIYIHEINLEDKVRHIACHELVHAFTAHLRLPPWLNEGLAMVMVDKLFGRSTVKMETLAFLDHNQEMPEHDNYRGLFLRNQSAIIHLYVRGYWTARYLCETQPGLIKELLARRQRPRELERRIAAGCGLSGKAFWPEMLLQVVEYFREGSYFSSRS